MTEKPTADLMMIEFISALGVCVNYMTRCVASAVMMPNGSSERRLLLVGGILPWRSLRVGRRLCGACRGHLWHRGHVAPS
jgi:hypothetical protein